MTWYAFACEIIRPSAERGGRSVPVDPITSSDYPAPVRRLANSRLSRARLEAVFDIRIQPMKSSLANRLDRLSPR
ncbi:hypothetical protein CWO89_14505 [Bradyrhizobium sp. Leo170]|nr:hypothetical protein CWO89_14505 [Bradyrhizobium sp. Leo170]